MRLDIFLKLFDIRVSVVLYGLLFSDGGYVYEPDKDTDVELDRYYVDEVFVEDETGLLGLRVVLIA